MEAASESNRGKVFAEIIRHRRTRKVKYVQGEYFNFFHDLSCPSVDAGIYYILSSSIELQKAKHRALVDDQHVNPR